jgi:hypothetical protein
MRSGDTITNDQQPAILQELRLPNGHETTIRALTSGTKLRFPRDVAAHRTLWRHVALNLHQKIAAIVAHSFMTGKRPTAVADDRARSE